MLTLYPYIKPIAIACERPPAGTKVIASGTGILQNQSVPNTLQSVQLEIASFWRAFEDNPNFAFRCNAIGAFGTGQRACCPGDSGGSLIIRDIEQYEVDILVGMTSFGAGLVGGSCDIGKTTGFTSASDYLKNNYIQSGTGITACVPVA